MVEIVFLYLELVFFLKQSENRGERTHRRTVMKQKENIAEKWSGFFPSTIDSVLFLFSFRFILLCFFIAKENVSHGTESEIDKSYAHMHKGREQRLKLLAADNRIGAVRVFVCVCTMYVSIYVHACSKNATEKKRDQVNRKCLKVYVTECGSWLVRRPA